MTTTRGRARWLAPAIWGAVAVMVLALPSVAAATPTAPGIMDATVYQGGISVTVWWTPSTDTQAGAIQYEVYRDDVPMTIATYLANGELVLTTSDTTVTVAPKADELAKKFTYYYMVVATNTTTGNKAVSSNVAPNVHGSTRSGYSVYTCQLCHSVHGAPPEGYLGAASTWGCYRCHGNTDATKSYGDKAVRNVQRDFYDYTAGQTIPTTVSRHYNQYMVDNETECTSCHTPHRSPYYIDPATGTKLDASSHTQLLRAELSEGTYYYSTDAVPSGNAFCLQCHGSSTSVLDFNAGAGTYDDTAGDHTYGTSAAHDQTVIYTNNDSHATNPGIQCEACHNKHASAADKLIAYRGDDSSATSADGTYAQAELCYACHSAATTETRVAAGYSAPYSWNGRDIKAQFQKASRHPTVARAGGPTPVPGTWTQTSQAEFSSDTLVNTVAMSAGSVELMPIYATGTLFSDDFTAGWGTWTTNGARWTVASGYANWQKISGTTRETGYIERTYDLSAVKAGSTPTLTFSIGTNALDVGSDYYQVQYSVDGGAFADLVAQSATARTWPTTLGPYNLTGAAGSSNVVVRFHASTNDTTEWIRYDDVAVSGLAPSGTFEASGSVVTGPVSPTGSLVAWGTLDFTENQPAGTNLTFDVLDASDDSVQLTNVADGGSLTALTASSLKLRANFTGDAPAARTATDDFNDNSFDTAKWSDVFLSSTDPDAAYSATLRSITFATALIDATTGMDSRSPNVDGTGWYRNNNAGQDGAAGYGRTGATEYDLERTMLKDFGDLSTLTSVDASFYWQNLGSNMTAGDYLYVEWSANGGTSWTTVGSVTATTADNTWGQLSTTGLAVGPNCQLRVRARVQDAVNDEWLVDSITVTGNYPAGTAWPRETGGTLTLRAEGTDFTGTTDEGEFAYIKPAAADWVDTEDFDIVVRVPSYNNLGADGWMKAGLMIRTGTTEANAYAANAAMVGLYVTDTNGVTFQYRTAAGGTASANVAGTGDAPIYLKLGRRGNVITGYKSTDGSSWTQVGTQAVTMSTYVLPGICLTSNVNGTFSEATFDDFSVTEAGLEAVATPALLDWSVSYTYFEPVTTGYATCTNCHNVHAVQRGTAGTVWQLVRASLPSNTKTTYTGTATAFCLECHDGTAPSTASNSATTLVPYTVEFSSPSPAPYFPTWNKSAVGGNTALGFTNSGHYAPAAGGQQALCKHCHDPHASDFARLTAWTAPSGSELAAGWTPAAGTRANTSTALSREQSLCYQCHGNGTTGVRASGAKDVATKAALANAHDPADDTSVHTDTETGAALGAAPHAECTDCHDPHVTKQVAGSAVHDTAWPGTNSSAPGSAVYGAWGVVPDYAAGRTSTSNPGTQNWATPTGFSALRLTGAASDTEAYLCFKCHSRNVGSTMIAGLTDTALEFNPSNFSVHNVLGQSVGMQTAFTVGGTSYTWTAPPAADFLLTGWTTNSMMTCTDCHTNDQNSATQAKGPHGSSANWIIDPAYPTNWRTTYISGTTSGMSNTTNICAKCHTNIDACNDVHGSHDSSSRGQCNMCHAGIPHGWTRPRLLAYTTDGAYASTEMRGIELQSYTYSNWSSGSCDTACAHSNSYTDTW